MPSSNETPPIVPAAECTTADGGDPVIGQVKWFDPARGYGFVVAEGVEGDILLHGNVLRDYGQGSVADGSTIHLICQMGERGRQAVKVLSVDVPEGPAGDTASDELSPIPDDLPYLPARVRWFDKSRGFGFANVFGDPVDVFVHVDTLRRFGLADLTTGEAICLRALDSARGRLAVEVRRWEFYAG